MEAIAAMSIMAKNIKLISIKRIGIIISLVFIFSISIFVRQSNFNRMLSDHHEWLTAHSLLTMKIWDCTSISDYFAQPVFTYPYKGDYGVSELGSLKGLVDNKLKGYYASYPQFSFQLPYFIFQLLHLKISNFNIQVLNLFFHFLSSLLLFLLIYRLLNVDFRIKLFSSFFTFCIYVFSSNNLWFLQNIWFADTLVQFFLIASIYLYFQYKSNSHSFLPVLLFILLMCITEWIGFLFAFVLAIFELYDIKAKKNDSKFLISLIVVVIIALLLIIVEYLSIASFNNLIEFWKFRFMSRTFLPNASINEDCFAINEWHSWLFLFQNYKLGYFQYLLFVLLLLILSIVVKFRNQVSLPSSIHLHRIWLLIIISILLHHFLFFSFTVEHDFALLKDSILLSLIVGMLMAFLLSNIGVKIYNYFRFGIVGLFICCTYFSIINYIEFNSNNCYNPNLFIDMS